jgi:ABC-type lipoprotein release transport system permease subunit
LKTIRLKFFLNFALKNLLRNPKRAGIVVLIVALGVFSSLLSIAIINGLNQSRLRDRLQNSLGHIKITHPDFDNSKPIQAHFALSILRFDSLQKANFVKAGSLRLSCYGMALGNNTPTSVDIYGVIPAHEKAVFTFPNQLLQGKYLPHTQSVVIGNALAKAQNLSIGSKLTLQLPTHRQGLAQDTFTISGIYQTNNQDYEATHLFIPQATFRALTQIPAQQYHQLVIKTADFAQAPVYAKQIAQKYPQYKTQSWVQISPDLALMHYTMQYFFAVFAGLIVFICGAIISNILLALLAERETEFDMLLKIGMTPQQLRRLLFVEITLLLCVGITLGLACVGIVLLLTVGKGINLAWLDAGLNAAGYNAQLFPLINWYEVVMMVGLFTLLALCCVKTLKIK